MMIDINTWFGHWPFQRFSIKSIGDLERHLGDHNISKALVSHLGTVFYQDPDPYNQELIKACRKSNALIPIPVINPHLNRWEDVLERYVDQGTRAVRIIPSFHNYRLYTRQVFDLVEALARHEMRLMIQMRMEDERDRYFALNIYGPKIPQVVKLAKRFPEFDFVCLNAFLPEAKAFGKQTENVRVDVSFAEWMYTMEELLSELTSDRIFFGSHTPLLYTLPTIMKLRDSGIEDALIDQIGSRNAVTFFGL